MNSLADINAEIIVIWTVIVQNRIALRLLLSAQGGTCAVIGSECCTYIPDKSEHFASLAEKLKKQSFIIIIQMMEYFLG